MQRSPLPETAARPTPLDPPEARARAAGHEPEKRFGLRIVLLASAFVLVAGPFGFLVSEVTGHGSLLHYDTTLASQLHRWALGGPGRVGLLKGITFFGSGPCLTLLVLVVAVALFIRRRPRLGAFVVVTAALGGLIDAVVKGWVGRSRPAFTHPIVVESGKSFPSGHAMSSTFVYGALALIVLPLFPGRTRALPVAVAGTLVITIGFSRLALGAHFLTDVLGGFALGLAWLCLSAAAFTAWRRERTGKPNRVTEGLEPEVSVVGRPEVD